jgi:hypothetical protein
MSSGASLVRTTDQLAGANVSLEVHPDWEQIVRMSYVAGLGAKGVYKLEEELFPRDVFPDKYDWNGNFLP